MSVYIKDPQQKAQACVIWMHGLGADAQDMEGLASALPLSVGVRHVFLDAPVRPVALNNHMPMRAWYNIYGMSLMDRDDTPGIKESEGIIRAVMDAQIDAGFSSEQIFLAGFSPLAGLIVLSAYLPLSGACQIEQRRETPLFVGSGTYDPIVLPAWTNLSVAFLRNNGFHNMVLQDYPMEHSICSEEINDLAHWLNEQVSTITRRDGVQDDNR